MATVERVRGRGLVRGIGRFEAGDVAEVSEDGAEYLVEENGDFRRVDDEAVSEADDEAAEGDGDDAEPVDEWEDWNEEDWLDAHHMTRASDVASGAVDDHLETIQEIDTSDSVLDAVEERRAKLE